MLGKRAFLSLLDACNWGIDRFAKMLMMRKRFLVLGWMLALIWVGTLPARNLRHDFHVCIVEVQHNAQTQSLEITIKLFTDDIERSMRTLGAGQMRLGDTRELPDADAKLLAYLQNRLALRINGQAVAYRWVGKEVELDALWCYVEVPDVAELKQLEVTNRILLEIFDDQANVVHVHVKDRVQSLFLDKTELSGQVSF
jgi:hypothetical protein